MAPLEADRTESEEPVYLQVGRAKSGNYWLYKILKNIQLEAGINRRSFIKQHPIYPIAREWQLSHDEQAEIDVLDVEDEGYFYRISSVFRMPVQDIDSYLGETTHVWTHSGCAGRTDELLSKVDRTVYIVRDPRDAAVSLSKFMFTPYMQTFFPSEYSDSEEYLREQFENQLLGWARHVAGYLSRAGERDIHLVFFERLLHDFESELDRLLDHLGVELSREQRSTIGERVSFSTMKSDNPQHVRKGKWGGWAEKLTSRQKRLASRRLGSFFELMGYPVDAGQLGRGLPASPGSISEEKAAALVREARPPAKRLLDIGLKVKDWKDRFLG